MILKYKLDLKIQLVLKYKILKYRLNYSKFQLILEYELWSIEIQIILKIQLS